MRTLVIALTVLAFVLLGPVSHARAEAQTVMTEEQVAEKLDEASALVAEDRFDEAIALIEQVLDEKPSHGRALKLYLRANEAKHAAQKKAAKVRREVEKQKAMKAVDEASKIPDKEYTNEPPVSYPKRKTSELSQEMHELLNQRIDVYLGDADLSLVLDLLHTTTGVNIIADRDLLVDKRVYIQVQQARLVDILDYIANNAGLTYVVNDSGIWLSTPTQPQLEIRVFHLRYGVTRTGQPIDDQKISNTASSTTNVSGNNDRTNTRNYRSPYSYRRFRKALEDAYYLEDVDDMKIDGAAGGDSSDYRAQMMRSLGSLMRMRAQQMDAQNNTSNNANNANNNGNSNGSSSENPSDMEKLFEWMSGWSGSLQWPEGSTWRFDPKTNSIVVASTPAMLDRIGKMIDEFDVPPIQVNIRTRFITVKVQEGVQWGIEGILQSALKQNDGETQVDAGSGWNLGVPSGDGTMGGNISFSGVLTDPQYNIIMNALQTNLDGRLLSEPNVTTLSNEPARLIVAEEFPYPTDWEPVEQTISNEGTIATSTTGYVPTDFETENIGITLDVMPSVGTDIDTIILELHPSIVTHDPNKDAKYNIISTNSEGETEAFEVTRPTFARQEIVAKVVIRSGQTVVLGGLIDEEEVTDVSKIPLLGDIPGIGALFRKTNKTKSRSNLLIFVTAEIVDTRGRFYHPEDEEKTSANGRDILPDIVPSLPPEDMPQPPSEEPEANPDNQPQPDAKPDVKPGNEDEKDESQYEEWKRKREKNKSRPSVSVHRPKPPKFGRKK